MNHSN